MSRYANLPWRVADVIVFVAAILLVLFTTVVIISHSKAPAPDIAIKDMLFAVLMMLIVDVMCSIPHRYISARMLMNDLNRHRTAWENRGYYLWDDYGKIDRELIMGYFTRPQRVDVQLRTLSLMVLLAICTIALFSVLPLSEIASEQQSLLYLATCMIPALMVGIGILTSIFVRTTMIRYFGTMRRLIPRKREGTV